MHVELRREQPADYRATEQLTREAFWNYYAPGCNEHYLIHTMRSHAQFVAELDVVAVVDGHVVGNVMYLQSNIEGDDGRVYEVLTLAPLAVHPSYQRQGIARQLVTHTLQQARALGYRAVILCGDPALYARWGFVPAEAYGIRTTDDMYLAALQVYELYEGTLATAQGRYAMNEVYNVDPAAVAEFDKLFPAKEPLTGTATQKRFEEVVAMQRKAFES